MAGLVSDLASFRKRFRNAELRRNGSDMKVSGWSAERKSRERKEDAALERSVKLSTMGYSITHSDELPLSSKGRSVESGWVMHECEGLWAIWYIYGWRAKAVVWRLTEGDRGILSRAFPSPVISTSHVEWKARGYWRRRFPPRAISLGGYWRGVRRGTKELRDDREHLTTTARFLRPFVNQDGNRINIKTVNLDAHNAASCHANKDMLLPGCCCLQSHNRARRVMAINKVASVGYNSCEPA